MSCAQKLPVHLLQQQGVSQFTDFFDLHGLCALSTSKNDSLSEGILIVLAIIDPINLIRFYVQQDFWQ